MPIFGAVIGFIAGFFLEIILANAIVFILPTAVFFFINFGLFMAIALGLYGAWIGWKMLPI